MKKASLIFTLLLAFGMTTASVAQFSIGPRIAANLANVDGESDGESVDADSRFGFAFGAAVEIGISEMFSIQPEVLYSQHGFKFSETLLDETIDFNFNHNYLQIPILAKVKFGGDPVGFHVAVGPHIGFGIGDVKSEATFMGETEEDTSSWEDAGFKTLDFGITGGAGVSFAAGPGSLGIDVRYQFGLANFLDEPEGDDFIKNRNLQIGLSYLIPIGGN